MSDNFFTNFIPTLINRCWAVLQFHMATLFEARVLKIRYGLRMAAKRRPKLTIDRRDTSFLPNYDCREETLLVTTELEFPNISVPEWILRGYLKTYSNVRSVQKVVFQFCLSYLVSKYPALMLN